MWKVIEFAVDKVFVPVAVFGLIGYSLLVIFG